MYLFSRIVFAFVGLMAGLFVGTAAAVLLALALLRNSEGGPGDGMGLILLAMLGAGFGAILGLAAGLVVPSIYEQRQNTRKERDARAVLDERVWPPPPVRR